MEKNTDYLTDDKTLSNNVQNKLGFFQWLKTNHWFLTVFLFNRFNLRQYCITYEYSTMIKCLQFYLSEMDLSRAEV